MKRALTLLLILGLAGIARGGFTRVRTIDASWQNILGRDLEDQCVYFVNSDLTLKGRDAYGTQTVDATGSSGVAFGDSFAALRVKSGATVILYIPKGVTLTLAGGNGIDAKNQPPLYRGKNAQKGMKGYVTEYYFFCHGSAGLSVPSDSTLIVTGEGKLVAQGGWECSGARGLRDSGTWDGHSGGPTGDPARASGDKLCAGAGGHGGRGGGGGAAGIGGNGGDGGESGDVLNTALVDIETGDKRQWETDQTSYGCGMLGGGSGKNGKPGAGCGRIYLLGSVTVAAKPGSYPYGATGGSAGGCSNHDWAFGWHHDNSTWANDYHAGPGGGGGGGGAGAPALYGIGGGGGGGGGGGSGSSGCCVASDGCDKTKYAYGQYWPADKDSRIKEHDRHNSEHNPWYVGGKGGTGGQSARTDGAGAPGATNGHTLFTKHVNDKFKCSLTTIESKPGGAGGAPGAYGANGTLYASAVAKENTRNAGTTWPDTAMDPDTAKDGYAGARYPVTYAFTGDNIEKHEAVLGAPWPTLNVPERFGYTFLGMYTEKNGRGERYFDETGHLVSGETAYSRVGGLTLYAMWKFSDEEDPEYVVFDKTGGRIDFDGRTEGNSWRQQNAHPTFTVKRDCDVVLRNLTVRGSDLGFEPAILTDGTLFVSNCVFENTYVPCGPGSVCRGRHGSRTVFYRCLFKDCFAAEGGVAYAENADLSFVDCSFVGNATGAAYGGSLATVIDGGVLNLVNCTTCSNRSSFATTAASLLTLYNLSEHSAPLNSIFVEPDTLVLNEGGSVTDRFTKEIAANNVSAKVPSGILGPVRERTIVGVAQRYHLADVGALTRGYATEVYRNSDWTAFSRYQDGALECVTPVDVDQIGERVVARRAGAHCGNTLQRMIDDAEAGAELLVPTNEYEHVTISRPLRLVGADPERTVISGNAYQPCLVLDAGAAGTEVCSLTFTNGVNSGAGGGISYAAGAAGSTCGLASNCTFAACTAGLGGGVAYLGEVTDCRFSNCTAGNGGGSYRCGLVRQSDYVGCEAVTNGGGSAYDGTVRTSIFRSCAAAKGGGAFQTRLWHCTLAQCVADDSTQAVAVQSPLYACLVYANELPAGETLVDTHKVLASTFANVFEGDFHLAVTEATDASGRRKPVDQSALRVTSSSILQLVKAEEWLDRDDESLLVSRTFDEQTYEDYLYAGCYAYAPFKIHGLTVTGTADWYDGQATMTSLREAVDTAATEPRYAKNGRFVIEFADGCFTNGTDEAVFRFGEKHIILSAFTNAELVIRGRADRRITIDGDDAYRAFIVKPGNRVTFENLNFTHCFGQPLDGTADGGALQNSGIISVSNCSFYANGAGNADYLASRPATGCGGAIVTFEDAVSTIWYSTFHGNRAARGGALHTAPGGLTRALFSTFAENLAQGLTVEDPGGGAVSDARRKAGKTARTLLVNDAFVGNRTFLGDTYGGAIATRGRLTLLGCAVHGNTSGTNANDIALLPGADVDSHYLVYGSRNNPTNALSGVTFIDDVVTNETDLACLFSTTTGVDRLSGPICHRTYPLVKGHAYPTIYFWWVPDFSSYGYGTIANPLKALVGDRLSLYQSGDPVQVDILQTEAPTEFLGPLFQCEAGTIPPQPKEKEVHPVVSLTGVDGNPRYFMTVAEAETDYVIGDAVEALTETANAEVDNAFFERMLKESEPLWFDFRARRKASSGLISYSVVLNFHAKPTVTSFETRPDAADVSVTPGNVKPNLWYALRYADALDSTTEKAFGPWQQADGQGRLASPLTAPQPGERGFYRVIASPQKWRTDVLGEEWR